MFVGCSEISISVIVKHLQHVGIIRAFCLPGGTFKFFSAWRTENIAGFWFVGSEPRLTLWMCEICSKLTIKTPKRRQRLCSSVFIIDFEQTNTGWKGAMVSKYVQISVNLIEQIFVRENLWRELIIQLLDIRVILCIWSKRISVSVKYFLRQFILLEEY